jgi:murein DD-endopeptidase MepM/ murein hydrolase activator NlpD
MMLPDPALALTCAAACAGSMLFAALAFALLAAAGRRWPALVAHRSVWALAQALVVLVFVSALVPGRDAGLLPVLRLEAPSAAPESAAPVTALATVRGGADSAPESETVPELADAFAAAALRWLPLAWLGTWLAGVGWLAARRLRAALRWKAIRAACRPLDPRELHAAGVLSEAQLRDIGRYRLEVRATAMAISPLLLGVARPCLLLPVHVARLGQHQQQMIVEHELTHWRRRDPAWLAVSGLLQLVFWFNLPFRRLAQGLAEAVELGCDDAVLAGRPQRERHAYAAALVAQLRLPRTGPGPAFGALGVAARVERMRAAAPARLGAAGRSVVVATGLGLALGAALVQPAISSTGPAPLALVRAEPAVPAGATDGWRYPLERVRVTSTFGIVSALLPNGHHGIDFAARRGTPVHAVAPGRVAGTGHTERYGNYVRIDHGAGRESLAIHLDSIAVRAGARVGAGQLVGRSGATGMATGPHLHLEYWQDGRRRDPRLMFPDLDAHTTAQALARRQSQIKAQLSASIPQE